MNSKKITKVISALLIAFMVIATFMPVFAVKDPKEINEVDANTQGLENFGGKLITIISTIGSIASIIVLVVLGIKYMMGSAEEKAEYKKTLLPYVIGAVFVFAASTIAGVIFNFASGM